MTWSVSRITPLAALAADIYIWIELDEGTAQDELHIRNASGNNETVNYKVVEIVTG